MPLRVKFSLFVCRCYLHGDVINQHKLFTRSDDDNEKPEQAKCADENLSVCSCACMDNRVNNGYLCCSTCCCFPTSARQKNPTITNNNRNKNNKFLACIYETNIVKRLSSSKRANKRKSISHNTSSRAASNIFELNNANNNEKEFSIVHIASSHSVKSFEF